METGFLSHIHDEEHFSSSYYNQENGLDDSEHMLFGEMIVPEVIDYDHLWQSVDDTSPPSQSDGDHGTRKEDFQRLLLEWQNQLSSMQEPEAIKQILPVDEKTTQEVSDIFANRTSSTPTAPTIDELFPLEFTKDTDSVEAIEEVRKEERPLKFDDLVAVIKKEKEEQVDVETVEEEMPLLMAGDLTSLLEQFEATEKVNSVQPLPSPPRPSSQTIRDALPAEVISRIKATRENHKKMISVIPAMPNKRPGRAATRMQDAGAALSRNKLLKLVTGGSSGESVQLDHDYCTSGDSGSNSSRSYYVSDSSEYPSQSSTPDATYSRLPEYIVALAPQRSQERARIADTGSRKDSGLESGENSDDEVQSVREVKSKVVLKSLGGLKRINVVTENGVVIGTAPVRNNIPMVSVLKKNVKVENVPVTVENDKSDLKQSELDSKCSVSTCTQVEEIDAKDTGKKKKKLNLEEYRVRREERDRIRSQESSRASSPVCLGSTLHAQPDSTTVTIQEGVPKEKPVMLSVEVQTQTCDFIDLTSSKSLKEQERSRTERKEKRNDLKHRSYRSRHASSSSSSSSGDSDRHRSHRRKRSSRRSRHRKNSVSRMWSRSPSRSSSRSHSLASSRSRSRSRSRDKRQQKWRSRSPRRANTRYNHNKSFHARDNRDRQWQRSRSPVRSVRNQEFGTQEKSRQMEERRVIYVGRIEEGTSKADLRKRFQQFGPIVDISVHFRERGDNYGFVTFAYKADAYKAVEHGNDDPKQPRYDLCFGGRRAFCKQRYADLDGIASTVHNQYGPPMLAQPRTNDGSFDLLLHEMKAQLRKRSSV